MNSLTRRKSIADLLKQADHSELKRTLTAKSLIALGIGAIIGAGLFVRTADASAQNAGGGVVWSFVIAAIGCAFAGICYAEFSAMIPIAGSAYTYAYTTMGEFTAWIIGWALVLEYALGAATVSISWSQYMNLLLGNRIPHKWSHGPLEGGIINIPALVILVILTLILIKGTQESAMVNTVIVAIKVTIVIVFIAIGWRYIQPANHNPLTIPGDKATFMALPQLNDYCIAVRANKIVKDSQDTPTPVTMEKALEMSKTSITPKECEDMKTALQAEHEGFFKHGWAGILGGAGIVFFAFIGFDAVSTAAQEAKKPERDMPIGILGSLAVCTVLYILFSWVLTGVGHWSEFAGAGKEASVAYAVAHGMPGFGWLSTAITVAILFGFSSVILVMLLGQSRVFYTMAKDGLLPKLFCDVHSKFRTPYKCNLVLLVFVGLFAAFLPEDIAGKLTSIGTLFAFVLVCIGVIIMRRIQPTLHRPFKTPLVPLVPILGVLVCTAMIVSLDPRTQLTALGWMLIGFLIYFLYGRIHSKLA
jgi:APA family basic amino acid/polyamine antiporter